MLEPGERTLLFDALTPPEGFTLDEAIGTTYTLDLLSLLAVPLAFTMFEWEDADGRPTHDPILLLEALRRHMSRITIFCQAGRMSAPARPNDLFVYLEESVVEVTSPSSEGVFHPKVWVLRYLGPEAEVRYRLVCLTRNLTEDRSWDLSLVLDGTLRDRQRAIAASRPLGDFVAALPGLAIRNVPPAAQARAQRLGDELRRVEWEVPEGFDEVKLHPMGLPGFTKDPLDDRSDRAILISPFLEAEYVGPWSKKGTVLVSRPEELDTIDPKVLAGCEEVMVLRQEASAEAEETDAVQDPDSTGVLKGLHAKCFIYDRGWNSGVFIGSANFTKPALEGRNVEFLVELIGKRSKVGVEQFLSGGPGEASFRTMLERYTPPDTPYEPDAVAVKLDRLVDLSRKVMAGAAWGFVVREGNTLSVDRPAGALKIPKECTVRVWPITLPREGTAKGLGPNDTTVSFGSVAPTALTSFMAVEIVARLGTRKQESTFVLNIPIDGAPADRREAVLRAILDDPQKVMRFLQFLLEDGETAFLGGELEHVGEGSVGAGSAGGFVLLEALLRALTREPSRLDHVHRLLHELGDSDEARRRLPPGFADVWPAIWAAHEEVAP